MIEKIRNLPKNKKIVGGIISLSVIALIIFILIKFLQVIKTPTITLMPPAPLESSNREEFVVDVILSDLPKNNYPAASLTIGFDKNKMEFTGTKLGTMMTYGDTTIDGNSMNIPLWETNIERANEIGQINTMYLDMTAGKYSYTREGFDNEKNNVLLRLGFKLKDSVSKGEVYNIKINDAVIATINGDINKTSLATNQKTLRYNNCKIVVLK